MDTAEVVLNGHPDKVCDLVADALLDEYLKYDPFSRAAIEVQGGHGQINVVGEVTSTHKPGLFQVEQLIKWVLKDIGYDYKFVLNWNVKEQSPEIAEGVDRGGAGDSGITIGYATSSSSDYLPKELSLARRIARQFDSRLFKAYGPDGKIQTSVKEGKAQIVVASIQHQNDLYEAKKEIEEVIRETLGTDLAGNGRILVNPAGTFKSGGFEADTGSTGRKIVADQYGPRIPVGGGAFSGKDPTKVDRSGAYWARKLALQAIEAGESEALVQLVWAIGLPTPLSATVNGKDLNEFDWYVPLSVGQIIEQLDLRQPIYYEKTKLRQL